MNKEYPIQFFEKLEDCKKVFESKEKDLFVFERFAHFEFPQRFEIRYEKIDLWKKTPTGIFGSNGKELMVDRCVKNLPDNVCSRCEKTFEPYLNCYVNKYIIYGDNRTVIRVYGNFSHICEECAKSYQRVKVFDEDGYVESVNHSGSSQINYCKSKSGVNPIFDEDAPKTIDAEILGIRHKEA